MLGQRRRDQESHHFIIYFWNIYITDKIILFSSVHAVQTVK